MNIPEGAYNGGCNERGNCKKTNSAKKSISKNQVVYEKSISEHEGQQDKHLSFFAFQYRVNRLYNALFKC
jgi:hypothetical protein